MGLMAGVGLRAGMRLQAEEGNGYKLPNQGNNAVKRVAFQVVDQEDVLQPIHSIDTTINDLKSTRVTKRKM